MSALFWFLTMAASAWVAYLTIIASRRLNLGADEVGGVQKFHTHWVPRLGGIPIFVSLVSSLLGVSWVLGTEVSGCVAFVVCILPAFGIGLVEDVTGRGGVWLRLAFTMVSAALGWWLLGGKLVRLDLPMVDGWLVAYPWFALGLTLVAVGGVAHAINIIDGYNGLSAFFTVAAFAALGVVAQLVGDSLIARISLLAAASVAGFMLWNFPFGRIFMGDSGAYLTGFALAELSVLLVTRNPEVSAWFPMLLLIYPVWETLFSIYRKAVLRGISPSEPDGLHFHMLVYKRLVKLQVQNPSDEQKVVRNSATSPYLWVLTLMTAIPALIFWNQLGWLLVFCGVFVAFYLEIYWRIVRFRAPKFLVLRLARQGSRTTAEI